MNISNRNFKNQSSVYVWHHPKKFLNKYFLKDKTYKVLSIKKELILGFFYFLLEIINSQSSLRKFYSQLPIIITPRDLIINIYSSIFYALIKRKFSKSTFILGDINYPLYKSLLIAASNSNKINIWIIYQGTGSINKMTKINYPSNVSKIFFPFSKDAFCELNKLREASKFNKEIIFSCIDNSLNIEIAKNKNVAIFQGYDKSKKLFPLYIFTLIKTLLELNTIRELKVFNKINIFLHPRINYLCLLNLINFNKKIKYELFNNNIKNYYQVIISYSPTVNSSFKSNISKNKNLFVDKGINFKKDNVAKKLRDYLQSK